MSALQSTQTLKIGDHEYLIYDFEGLKAKYDVSRLPFQLYPETATAGTGVISRLISVRTS